MDELFSEIDIQYKELIQIVNQREMPIVIVGAGKKGESF